MDYHQTGGADFNAIRERVKEKTGSDKEHVGLNLLTSFRDSISIFRTWNTLWNLAEDMGLKKKKDPAVTIVPAHKNDRIGM